MLNSRQTFNTATHVPARKRKQKYNPTRSQVDAAVKEFLKNGGVIEKLTGVNDFKSYPSENETEHEFLCDCGKHIPRDIPIDHYGWDTT